jgi:polyisoprenoid-binding protein YceI
MTSKTLKTVSALSACCLTSALSLAAPVTYEIDPSHTYPAFEADHLGGLSIWRGKIASTTGNIVLDKEAETGSVTVEMDMASIDFSHEAMNKTARENILNVAEFPMATYSGTLTDFIDGQPTKVDGALTMHGVTQDVDLDINKFQCQKHYRYDRESCGADASAMIDRADFGVDFGADRGHLTEIKLLISVEANGPEAK